MFIGSTVTRMHTRDPPTAAPPFPLVRWLTSVRWVLLVLSRAISIT
jgi:hypothetical protein